MLKLFYLLFEDKKAILERVYMKSTENELFLSPNFPVCVCVCVCVVEKSWKYFLLGSSSISARVVKDILLEARRQI